MIAIYYYLNSSVASTNNEMINKFFEQLKTFSTISPETMKNLENNEELYNIFILKIIDKMIDEQNKKIASPSKIQEQPENQKQSIQESSSNAEPNVYEEFNFYEEFQRQHEIFDEIDFQIQHEISDELQKIKDTKSAIELKKSCPNMLITNVVSNACLNPQLQHVRELENQTIESDDFVVLLQIVDENNDDKKI